MKTIMTSQDLFLKWRKSFMPKLSVFKRIRNTIIDIYKLNMKIRISINQGGERWK